MGKPVPKKLIFLTNRRDKILFKKIIMCDFCHGLTTVHMVLQVQEAVKCRVVDRQEDGNGDSGGSFQNGHAQLMVLKSSVVYNKDAKYTHFILSVTSHLKCVFVFFFQTDFEKDVDIACRSGTA